MWVRPPGPAPCLNDVTRVLENERSGQAEVLEPKQSRARERLRRTHARLADDFRPVRIDEHQLPSARPSLDSESRRGRLVFSFLRAPPTGFFCIGFHKSWPTLRDVILAIFDPCRPSPANPQRSYGGPLICFIMLLASRRTVVMAS
jgi:hypothetical protein